MRKILFGTAAAVALAAASFNGAAQTSSAQAEAPKADSLLDKAATGASRQEAAAATPAATPYKPTEADDAPGDHGRERTTARDDGAEPAPGSPPTATAARDEAPAAKPSEPTRGARAKTHDDDRDAARSADLRSDDRARRKTDVRRETASRSRETAVASVETRERRKPRAARVERTESAALNRETRRYDSAAAEFGEPRMRGESRRRYRAEPAMADIGLERARRAARRHVAAASLPAAPEIYDDGERILIVRPRSHERFYVNEE